MSSIQPFQLPVKLHGNPKAPPTWSQTVKNQSGEAISVADTRATRAMISLMNMGAVQGGAACHFGGPSAFAEIMSATFGYMFWKAEKEKKQWHELFHFANDAGHCENGLYALRANYKVAGLSLESLYGFRSIDSVLTGHGEAHLFPEAVWISNGPLGSGLPQAQGLAAAESMSKNPRITITAISDGGCMEGEAREAMAAIPGLAANGKVGPCLVLLSDNNTKLSGRIDQDSFSMNPTFNAMESKGWKVIKVDEGHDQQKVFTAIEQACESLYVQPQKPVFVWFKTIKGRGTKKTEASSSGAHGFPLKKADELSAFLSELYNDEPMPQEFVSWMNQLIEKEKKPASASSGPAKMKIQEGVAKALIEAVEKNNRPVISISADLQGSTGVEAFRKKFPDHCFEVGVAEANMVSMGTGLSKQGYIPIVDTFAQFGVTKGALPFIMSGLSEGPMIGIFSHTGFQDAADGASHQALSYAAMMGSIPHVDVYCLTCSDEAYQLVSQAIEIFAERRKAGQVPRSSIFFLGRENFPANFNPNATYKLGKAQILSDETKGFTKNVVLAPSGSLISYAYKAQEALKQKNIGSIIVNPSIINHPDVDTFKSALQKCDGHLLTIEDHRAIGGEAAYLSQALLEAGVALKKFKALGVGDEFGRSAYKADHLYKMHNLDDKAIVESALKFF